MFSTGQKSEELITYLQKRRSCSLKNMGTRAPSKEEIEQIISIATRVPDHGKLCPWYFIVFEGEARQEVGKHLRQAYAAEDPEASPAKLDLEAERFLRAPLVILAVSHIRHANKPVWEQILSSGAACYNLYLAANALGYGTNWLSEWYSYNDVFKNAIGLDKHDHIAGAIYIGNVEQEPEERPRPEINEILTYWSEGKSIQKGDIYDSQKPVIPTKGFTFPSDFR